MRKYGIDKVPWNEEIIEEIRERDDLQEARQVQRAFITIMGDTY